MQIAHDYNDRRVHISETVSNQCYYCPFCGAPLVARKGEVNKHHFAHAKNHACKDSWSRNGSYNISPWHNEWQALFPKDNQEIKLSLGDTVHRADILIDRSVVEFQHSGMANNAFDDRNNFYCNLGYKVTWLFDLSDVFEKKMYYEKEGDRLVFTWNNPKRAFNNHDIKQGNIDLFFQIKKDEELCIVKVLDVSENGYEEFYTTDLMSKNEFLDYIGLKEGVCLPPCKDYIEEKEQYRLFKKKYHIELNKQQERAMLAVEGSNLLLAVPGSGKTSLLIARLGHMIINKKISPESILAITYNNTAADELKERFDAKFGKDIGGKVEIRTINSFCNTIYMDYCKSKKVRKRNIINDNDKRKIVKEIYKECTGINASEYEVIEFNGYVSYIKNMMLDDNQIDVLEYDFPHLHEMYNKYNEKLKNLNAMDYDDQLRYAEYILNKYDDILNDLKEKYKYICVDEAQDTSKLQHRIIHKITDKNLFMVGDEDQSIYGYRAAYPKALLNFRYDYKNPYILRMENNYRSTHQIVELAQKFISQNKGRYEKNMKSVRGEGDDVHLECVKTREEQYERLLEVAKNVNVETAFLYRDNESAIVLVDMLLRNNIVFKLQKPVMNFFGGSIVKDIVAYLSIAVHKNREASYKQIYNKGIIESPKNQTQSSKEMFRIIMQKVSNENSLEAISIILDGGYKDYLTKKNLDVKKIDILKMLAKNEPNIENFIRRLEFLEDKLSKNIESANSNIVLSTIHSSKGMEFDTVYIFDVYDGRFPSSAANLFYRSKDAANGEQEERRLFYVAMTRAKNHLHLIRIENEQSVFIDSLFPRKYNEVKVPKMIKEELVLQTMKTYIDNSFVHENKPISVPIKEDKKDILITNEVVTDHNKSNVEISDSVIWEQLEEEQYIKGYNEVKDLFVQTDKAIYDSFNKRWIKCEKCNTIKQADEFSYYGGPKKETIGLCNDCYRKERE